MVKCSECGKEISMIGVSEWAYRVKSADRGYDYQCGYACWRERTKWRFKRYEEYIKAKEREDLQKEQEEDFFSR